MFGERMGVPFLWTDVRLLYLPVSSFFDLVFSQSYSCRRQVVRTGQIKREQEENGMEAKHEAIDEVAE